MVCGSKDPAARWRYLGSKGSNPSGVRFVNGYLTTPGQPAPEVWGMIEDLGFKIEVDYQQAAEKGPQLRSQSRESLNVLQ